MPVVVIWCKSGKIGANETHTRHDLRAGADFSGIYEFSDSQSSRSLMAKRFVQMSVAAAVSRSKPALSGPGSVRRSIGG